MNTKRQSRVDGAGRFAAGLLYHWRKMGLPAKASVVLLVMFYGTSIFAGFFAPYDYREQFREYPYAPPSEIRFFAPESEGGGLTGPYIHRQEIVDRGLRKYREVIDVAYPIKLFPGGGRLFGLSARAEAEGVRFFLMGSDSLGRDFFSRLLYGGRVSLFIGVVGVLISFTIGTIVGSISGYVGGRTDEIIMRLCEIMMSLPSFYFLLALAVVIPTNLSSAATLFLIIAILAFIGWAGFARVIRGMVLSLREAEYVLAARSLGSSWPRLLLRHIVPGTFNYTVVAASIAIPGYILGESGLSFLGLGIREPDASWGNMLTEAQRIVVLTNYQWILLPGVLIFATVMSFNFIGDYLRDALDPTGDWKK